MPCYQIYEGQTVQRWQTNPEQWQLLRPREIIPFPYIQQVMRATIISVASSLASTAMFISLTQARGSAKWTSLGPARQPGLIQPVTRAIPVTLSAVSIPLLATSQLYALARPYPRDSPLRRTAWSTPTFMMMVRESCTKLHGPLNGTNDNL